MQSDSTLRCWGKNDDGQLGNGTLDKANAPVKALGGNYSEVAAGTYHTCARAAGATDWCWGFNKYGQLGNGNKVSSHHPVRVV